MCLYLLYRQVFSVIQPLYILHHSQLSKCGQHVRGCSHRSCDGKCVSSGSSRRRQGDGESINYHSRSLNRTVFFFHPDCTHKHLNWEQVTLYSNKSIQYCAMLFFNIYTVFQRRLSDDRTFIYIWKNWSTNRDAKLKMLQCWEDTKTAREENSSDLFLITITSQPLTASLLTLRQNIAATECERCTGLHTVGFALYILMLMCLLQF